MKYIAVLTVLMCIAAAGFFSAIRPGECQSYYAAGDIYTVCVVSVSPDCQAEIFTRPSHEVSSYFGTAVIQPGGWINESDILPRMYCGANMLQLSSYTKTAVSWLGLPVVRK